MEPPRGADVSGEGFRSPLGCFPRLLRRCGGKGRLSRGAWRGKERSGGGKWSKRHVKRKKTRGMRVFRHPREKIRGARKAGVVLAEV